MTRKWIVAFTTLVMALLQACGQQQATEYGIRPLILDDFTFDLDIPQFFRDERIFRYTHDEFSVGSEEYRLDDEDRKSTRLNSSHVKISYAVFCLKKKKKI